MHIFIYYLRSIIPYRIFGPSVQVFALVLRLQGHQNMIPRGGFRLGIICHIIPTTCHFIFLVDTRDICYTLHMSDSHNLLKNSLVCRCMLSESLQTMNHRGMVLVLATSSLWFIFCKLSDSIHRHTRPFSSKW